MHAHESLLQYTENSHLEGPDIDLSEARFPAEMAGRQGWRLRAG